MFTVTPLKFFVQSFWRDEAFSYVLASKGFLEIISLTARDFNPPLYYLVLNIWMKIFGTSEIAMRSLSLIFFWCMMYVVFLFLYDVMRLSYKKALLYLGLLLINPFLIYFAFEARMYSMFAFLASLSFYTLFTNKKRGYIIATVLGLYTHYFMVFVLLTQVIFLLHTTKRRLWLKEFKKLVVPVLLFLPWVIYVLWTNVSLGESFWISKIPYRTLFYLPSIIFTGFDKNLTDKDLPIFSLTVTSVFITLLTLFVIFKVKRRDNVSVLFALWAYVTPILLFFISLYKPLLLPRYFIFTGTGMVLLLIYAIEQIRGKAKLIVLFILIGLSIYHLSLSLNYNNKKDFTTVFHEIKALANEGDVVYVTDILDFSTAQYYFDIDRVYIYNKKYEDVPAFVGKVLIDKDRLRHQYPFYPQKAFVLREDGTFDVRAIF